MMAAKTPPCPRRLGLSLRGGDMRHRLYIAGYVDLDPILFPLSEEDEREWFKDVVINGTGTLLLHSNEIGDELGVYHVTGSSIYKNTGEAKDGSKDTTVPEVPGDNNS